MENLINDMGLVNCEKVYGYGVFAKKDIIEGEIIETGLMSIVNNVDGNLNTHLFTCSDDRLV